MKTTGPYGPRDKLPPSDLLWPRLHRRWWGRIVGESQEEIAARIRRQDTSHLPSLLDHAKAIASTASERAAAADRRAATVAGAVAIASSFTLSGAGLVVDPALIDPPWIRVVCAAVLALTTVAFVLAAVFALRALVRARLWHWELPGDLPRETEESSEERSVQRIAHLLHDFTGNWEISDWKNRNVDNSLRCLVGALTGVALLAILVASSVAWAV